MHLNGVEKRCAPYLPLLSQLFALLNNAEAIVRSSVLFKVADVKQLVKCLHVSLTKGDTSLQKLTLSSMSWGCWVRKTYPISPLFFLYKCRLVSSEGDGFKPKLL